MDAEHGGIHWSAATFAALLLAGHRTRVSARITWSSNTITASRSGSVMAAIVILLPSRRWYSALPWLEDGQGDYYVGTLAIDGPVVRVLRSVMGSAET
jgi:hypothetical protein